MYTIIDKEEFSGFKESITKEEYDSLPEGLKFMYVIFAPSIGVSICNYTTGDENGDCYPGGFIVDSNT